MIETKLRIHIWPERIIRQKCRKVNRVDKQIQKLLDEMYVLMKSLKGVGLAANQAGLDISLVVVEAEDRVFKLVNPKIVKKEGKINFKEGCLSFPGLELEITRSDKAWVFALNEKGEPLELETEGVLAVIFQHEIDHVNGILFIDRLPIWQRVKIYPQLKKIKRGVRDGMRK
jgi:peptide deformylase